MCSYPFFGRRGRGLWGRSMADPGLVFAGRDDDKMLRERGLRRQKAAAQAPPTRDSLGDPDGNAGTPDRAWLRADASGREAGPGRGLAHRGVRKARLSRSVPVRSETSPPRPGEITARNAKRSSGTGRDRDFRAETATGLPPLEVGGGAVALGAGRTRSGSPQ